jgi:hypothetical protein
MTSPLYAGAPIYVLKWSSVKYLYAKLNLVTDRKLNNSFAFYAFELPMLISF